MNTIYFLKMTLRSWNRNLLSSVISILSLAVGLACSVTLILFVLTERDTAKALGDDKNVCLLQVDDRFYQGQHVPTANIFRNVPLIIEQNYPEVENYAVFHSLYWEFGAMTFDKDDPQPYSVTPSVCDLFDIPVLEGDLRKTLQNPAEAAVMSGFLNRYIAANGPLENNTIRATERVWDQQTQQMKRIERAFVVTTILDDSRPLPLCYGMLTRMPDGEITADMGQSQTGSYMGFLKLRNGVDPAGFDARMNADTTFAKLIFKREEQNYYISRLEDHYFSGTADMAENPLIVTRDPMLLTISLSVALVILLIAGFNYINVTMTRAGSRLKNIAGQRIMGASAWSVRWQIVLDTVMNVLVAFLLALFVLKLVLPVFGNFMQVELTVGMLLRPLYLAAVLGLMVLVVGLASAYILTKMEVRSPLAIFKSASQSRLALARTMVIAQFVLSVALIAVSLNVSRQMSFIMHSRPNMSRLLTLNPGGRNPIPVEVRDRIVSQAFVERYTQCYPLDQGRMSVTVGGKTMSVAQAYISPQSMEMYGLKLLEGRPLGESEPKENILANQALVRRLELKDPVVGQTFNFNRTDYRIIGVVEDMQMETARREVSPLFYNAMPENSSSSYYGWGLVLQCSGNMDAAIEAIKDIWHEMQPNEPPLDFRPLEQTYEEMNIEDVRLNKIVITFTMISIALTALGLFGLAWYTVERRRREIALRKIHGSTRSQILGLLCRTFFGWVAISVVIALPIAWWLTEEWLSGFVYKVDNSIWVLVVTAAVAAAVTFLTVITQSWRAASTNPAACVKAE